MAAPPAESTAAHVSAHTLPDQVARLAAANETLMSSLHQAHTDLAAMLVERDTLSDALTVAEGTASDLASMSRSLLEQELQRQRRYADSLRRELDELALGRRELDAALAVLHPAATGARSRVGGGDSVTAGAAAGAAGVVTSPPPSASSATARPSMGSAAARFRSPPSRATPATSPPPAIAVAGAGLTAPAGSRAP